MLTRKAIHQILTEVLRPSRARSARRKRSPRRSIAKILDVSKIDEPKIETLDDDDEHGDILRLAEYNRSSPFAARMMDACTRLKRGEDHQSILEIHGSVVLNSALAFLADLDQWQQSEKKRTAAL